MAEAKYYLIQGLVDMCQAALQVRTEVACEMFHRCFAYKINLRQLERLFHGLRDGTKSEVYEVFLKYYLIGRW